MRRTHLVKPNSITANYLRIGSMGLGACIDKVVEGSDWKNKFSMARHWSASRTGSGSDRINLQTQGQPTEMRKLPYGKGIGIACSSYICGAGLPIYWNNMPQSGVQLRLDRQGGVCVMCGSTDIGQGSDSILAYIVAEVLGIDPFDIRVVTADTDLTPVDLGSYSSRVTLMTGNAAIQAAERARDLLAMAVAEKLSVPVENISLGRTSRVRRRESGGRRFICRGGGPCRIKVRHDRHGRFILAAAVARADTKARASVRRRPTAIQPPSLKSMSIRPTGIITVERIWIGS